MVRTPVETGARPAVPAGRLRALAGLAAFILACGLMGYISVLYGTWVDEKFLRIVLLPAALVLAIVFLLDKTALFLLLMLVRVPADSVIEAARFGPMTAGAVMNGLIIVIAGLLFIERPRVALKTALPMWMPLVLIMLVETLRAPELVTGIRSFLAYSTYVAVFMVPFYLKQCRTDMRFCIGLVLLSSVVPAFYGLVDYAQGGYGGLYGDRISSTFTHPNIFAFYLVMAISLAFYLLKSAGAGLSALQRVLLLAYVGLLMVDLILTKTRSAWAACFVLFLVYGVAFERRYLVYLAIATGAALLVPQIQERLLDVGGGSAYWNYGAPQNSYEWRRMIWEAAWGWMKPAALVFGYGLGSFAYYSVEFFPFANRTTWGAHNLYMQWFFEAGVVGLACAGWLYFRVFALLKSAWSADRLGTVIMITIVVEYLVVSYSDNMLDYLTFNWYFWFVVGTACSIAVARNEPAPESSMAPRHFAAFAGRSGSRFHEEMRT